MPPGMTVSRLRSYVAAVRAGSRRAMRDPAITIVVLWRTPPRAERERGQWQEGKPRAHGADHRVIDGKEVRQRLVHHVNAERDAQGHPGGAEMDHAVPHRTAVATITRCAVNATKAPPTRWKPSALAAPY